ncbi:MAG: biotin--[acetyl-CoA-carboxylase] ligase [Candidatus Desulfofervidaceae bacterium]|nr:biotin--[acetyl-CoA-carboxylase] ligase [Candidatus Desulfofervidaceae bacterium]
MGRGITRNLKREETIQGNLALLKQQEFNNRYSQIGERAERIWRRGEILGAYLYCYSSAHRTMDIAKQYIDRAHNHGQIPYSGTVFIAEELTQARGRYKREWFAPHGGLWFSYILFPEVESPYLHLYPLVTGIACCEALRDMGIEVKLKWINDLMFAGRKLGGILGETYFSPSKETYLIFGIGINVNNFLPEVIKHLAISIKEITKEETDLDAILCLTLVKLIWYIGLLHEAEIVGDTREIIEIWRQYTDSLGREAIYGEDLIRRKGEKVEILDIDPYGGLVIRSCKTKDIRTVYSGELIYLSKRKRWLR